MSSCSARGITAAGRESDGDWLGTAYFGQKTGDYFRQNIEVPFFDHFLKDKGDISNIKEVNVFDTGSHEWKSLESWSPKNGITETPIYLQANGGLSFAAAGKCRIR